MNPEHAERAEGFVSESDAGGLLLLLCSYSALWSQIRVRDIYSALRSQIGVRDISPHPAVTVIMIFFLQIQLYGELFNIFKSQQNTSICHDKNSSRVILCRKQNVIFSSPGKMAFTRRSNLGS
jgi:hypothetical protein